MKLSRLPGDAPEIFSSIQGEGVSMGVPSVFVRLSGCNLHCAWCDTKYTWDWTQYDPQREIIVLNADDIARRVSAAGIHNVVITGGEPLLQQRSLGLLGSLLKDQHHRIEVETNGTIAPQPAFAPLVDQWNVSPKLVNSGNTTVEREVPAVLSWFAAQPAAYFKFVVTDPSDLVEVDALAHRYSVPADRILLMPEGRDPATLTERSQWLVERCREHGYRFTTRLHVLLWGDKRGR